MIKIKQQVADAEEIYEKVLTDVFGEDWSWRIFNMDEYDMLYTIAAINTAALTRKKRFNERKEND